jgi:cytochrome c-type biogenesis protein
MAEPTIFIAIIAGLVSFASPCVLPILPGFLGYLGGSNAVGSTNRWTLFLNSVFFVLGFSVIFAALGVLLNTVLEGVSYTVQEWLSRVGGIIIILFGLFILGVLKIPFLMQEKKFHVEKKDRSKAAGFGTSFVFGAAFAVGWSPCVGAILGTILALAIATPGKGFILLLAYALGLGIPFLVVGLFASQALALLQKSTRFLKYFNMVVGVLLIAMGILVFLGKLAAIANLAASWWVMSS